IPKPSGPSRNPVPSSQNSATTTTAATASAGSQRARPRPRRRVTRPAHHTANTTTSSSATTAAGTVELPEKSATADQSPRTGVWANQPKSGPGRAPDAGGLTAIAVSGAWPSGPTGCGPGPVNATAVAASRP